MSDDPASVSKTVRTWLDYIALGFVLTGIEQILIAGKWERGSCAVVIGGIFLFFGIMGPKIKDWVKSSFGKQDAGYKRMPRTPLGVVEIIEALYGAGESWADATKGVRNQIDTHGGVIVAETPTLHVADPAYGKPKELRIRYRIGGEEMNLTIPEHSSANLGEPALGDANGIDVDFAFKKGFATWIRIPSVFDWIVIVIALALATRAAFIIYSDERRSLQAVSTPSPSAEMPDLVPSPTEPSPSPTVHFELDHLSNITPEYITSQIESALPLQRENIAAEFVGAPVKWKLFLENAWREDSEYGNKRFIHVSFIHVIRPESFSEDTDVDVVVPEAGNEFLKLAKQGDVFIVSGTMSDVSAGIIQLGGVSIVPSN